LTQINVNRDLFEALLLRESQRVMDEVVQRIESDPEGGTLINLYSVSLVCIAANPLLRALVIENKRLLGEATIRFRKSPYASQWRALSVDIVRQFQEAGLIRSDISPEAATYFLAVVRYGVLTLDDYLPEVGLPLDAISELLPDLVRRALAPEDGGNREAGKHIIAQMTELTRKMFEAYREKKQL
jgi:hypothetical protein